MILPLKNANRLCPKWYLVIALIELFASVYKFISAFLIVHIGVVL